ncbi:lasso RiPP family leader peptide-containing protein [Streptomyces flavidovirens]|uniref:lasso RiPP family leader peptide-containing protein n=1 Tax=Streptomyces flavidovirens TaxID=67298 RepID=UPI000D13144E
MTLLRKYAQRSAARLRPSVSDTGAQQPQPLAAADLDRDDSYAPPVVVDLGHVREVTLGSSSSGTADANSHYYW